MSVKSEINHLTGTQKELSVEAPVELVQQEFEKAYAKWSRTAKVPGFRVGKVPRSVIRQKFQKEVRETVADQLLPLVIQEVLDEHQLNLVTDPKIHDFSLQEGHPLKLRTTVEVYPQFEVKGYKGLNVRKRVTSVTPADVDRALEELRQKHAHLIPVEDRSSQSGDFATLILSAKFVDPPAQGDSRLFVDQAHEIEIGSEDVLSAISENLKGMGIGESRTFRLTYPTDYGSSQLAGREVEYDAKLEALRRKELLDLDDDFPNSIGEDVQSLAAFRDELGRRIQKKREEKADNALPEAVLEQLVRNNPIDVPDTFVRRRLESRVKHIMRGAMSQGVDPRSPDIDWEAIAKEERQGAIEDIRASMLLERIAEQEALTVSEAELEAALLRITAERPESPDLLRGRLTKEGALDSIRIEIRNRKALELIVQAATVEREVVDGESSQ